MLICMPGRRFLSFPEGAIPLCALHVDPHAQIRQGRKYFLHFAQPRHVKVHASTENHNLGRGVSVHMHPPGAANIPLLAPETRDLRDWLLPRGLSH